MFLFSPLEQFNLLYIGSFLFLNEIGNLHLGI